MKNTVSLSKEHILAGLDRLDKLATNAGKKVEISLYGGAAMVLSFDGVRTSTYDVDAVIRSGRDFVRQAAKTIAQENVWDENWLNDAVKGFVSETEALRPLYGWADKEVGLVVQVAAPEYLLAMKCIAMRLDSDSHDIEDIKTLLKECGLEKADDVLDLVERFYPKTRIPPKVSLGVASIFEDENPDAIPDTLVQHVIASDLNPRELGNSMPGVNADALREKLRKAASNPEAWGVEQEAFETWGKNHGVGRTRISPGLDGNPKTEIVYDDF
jgi:hypothetical protein